MAELDTKVLVRYIVEEDASQLAAATRLIRGAVRANETLFVPVTVALELEWVLRASYGFAKAQVALAHSAGESPLWTFDKPASKVDGARLLTA